MSVREEIELVRRGTGWLLFDPLRHRYFATDRDRLATLADGDDGGFARANELLRDTSATHSRTLSKRAAAARESWWKLVLHRYLFVRIPLARPDPWLDAMLPLVRPLMSRAAGFVVAVLGLSALLLIAERWGTFVEAFEHSLTFDGLALYAVALAALKIAHELGHAFALKRHGGSVPSMGIAFVVGMPILYTDTSDAWRLERRRDRLAVDLAGIAVELAIAVFATWAWLLLPEGAARSVAFSLAAVSWTISLAVNLNPFMRFDGYHVLADALDLPNLQERAFALGRWRLREALFAPGLTPPEPFPPARRRLLVCYAWLTWVYRLVLFTGIALLIYHATFKVLGIVLFAVEMGWFVVRPVSREVRDWPKMVRSRRAFAPLLLPAACAVLLAAPLDRSVDLPAVLKVGDVRIVRAAAAGALQRLAADGPVGRGDLLARTVDAAGAARERIVLARRAAFADRSIHAKRALLQRTQTQAQLLVADTDRAALVRRSLVSFAVAPHDGTFIADRDARDGRSYAKGDRIGILIRPGNRASAVATEAQIERLLPAGAATFYAGDGSTTAELALVARADARQLTLDPIELAARHGGPVRTTGDDLKPARPRFSVRFAAGDVALPDGRWRGTVRVEVAPRSYGRAIWERLHAVWIREAGF